MLIAPGVQEAIGRRIEVGSQLGKKLLDTI
jgi:hypothetical protein